MDTDLTFSVGCILHAVHLGGKPPFRNNGSTQTARTHLEHDLVQGTWKGGRRWQEAGEEVRGKLTRPSGHDAASVAYSRSLRSLAQAHHTASPTETFTHDAAITFVLFIFGNIDTQLLGPIEFRKQTEGREGLLLEGSIAGTSRIL